MEVHFSQEQEAKLSEIAAQSGTEAELLVREAALRLVDEAALFRAAVREGLQQAASGKLLEDDEVRVWLEEQQRR